MSKNILGRKTPRRSSPSPELDVDQLTFGDGEGKHRKILLAADLQACLAPSFLEITSQEIARQAMDNAALLMYRLKEAHLPSFIADEIKQYVWFSKRLIEHSDELTKYLWEKLPPHSQKFLEADFSNPEKHEKVTRILVWALNEAVKDKNLYSESRFYNAPLKVNTLALLNKKRSRKTEMALNRRLLLDAFPLFLTEVDKVGVSMRALRDFAAYPLECFLMVAGSGNQRALAEMVKILNNVVEQLNQLAQAQPDFIQAVAAECKTWPILYSKHPKLNHDPKKIFNSIGLGSANGLFIDEKAQWDPKNPACKIALQLFQLVDQMPAFKVPCQTSPETSWMLPHISQPGAALARWNEAEKIFDASYPNPKENKTLRDLTELKRESKVNAKIKEIIKKRFISLFPKNIR